MPQETLSYEVLQLDRLIQALEHADDSLRSSCMEVADQSLTEALEIVATLYGSLSPHTSPEASVQLEAVYDSCIRALGDACGGDHGALVRSVVMLRAIRNTVAGTASRSASRAA